MNTENTIKKRIIVCWVLTVVWLNNVKCDKKVIGLCLFLNCYKILVIWTTRWVLKKKSIIWKSIKLSHIMKFKSSINKIKLQTWMNWKNSKFNFQIWLFIILSKMFPD